MNLDEVRYSDRALRDLAMFLQVSTTSIRPALMPVAAQSDKTVPAYALGVPFPDGRMYRIESESDGRLRLFTIWWGKSHQASVSSKRDVLSFFLARLRRDSNPTEVTEPSFMVRR